MSPRLSLSDKNNNGKIDVMIATTAAAIICPPCALAAIAVSAGYSLFLEDQIFEPVKE